MLIEKLKLSKCVLLLFFVVVYLFFWTIGNARRWFEKFRSGLSPVKKEKKIPFVYV